jgi:CheY-like chemotaxis protein
LSDGKLAHVRTLIVEHQRDLAEVWARFLTRNGLTCTIAGSEAEAYDKLREGVFDAIVLDMELPEGTAIAVADFATYRNPDIPIIAVTARGFFSDSAILQLVPNARGLLRESMRLDDMAALVQHYGGRYAADSHVQTPSGGQ